MTFISQSAPLVYRRTHGITGRVVGIAVLWFCIFVSGFVIREPAPYDLLLLPVIGLWFLIGGLKIHAQMAPGFLLMLLFLTGGILSATQATVFGHVPLYLAVTAFLIGNYIFFANLIAQDRSVLFVIRNAYIWGATIVAMIGILGYFGAIPGAESFTLYGRAKGTFQDPNVFGPFLVLPIALLTQDFLTKPLKKSFPLAPALLILLLGVFLSFSRAAWGMTVLSMAAVTLIIFICDPRPTVRLRIIGIAIAGFAVAVAGLAIALSFESVSEIFTVRAKLVQPYDAARVGRFARYSLGFAKAFEAPLGIGPMQFRNFFPEDPHNVYMKSFLDHGWLGGISYVTFVVWTLFRGFPLLFKEQDWSPVYRATFVVFVAHVLGGIIIDTDHWRHLYLIWGILWGCFVLHDRPKPALGTALVPVGRP